MTDRDDPRVLESRRRIARSAMELFERAGYVGTTVADIADGAGVALQTVYNAVGSKAAVLNLVLDTAAAGDRSPTPVVTFMQQRTSATSGAGELVDLLADWFAEVHPRTSHRVPDHPRGRRGRPRDRTAAGEARPGTAGQLPTGRQRAAGTRAQAAVPARPRSPPRSGASATPRPTPCSSASAAGRSSKYRDWVAHALHGCMGTRPAEPSLAAAP